MAKDGECKIAKAEANFSTKKTNGGKLKGKFPHISLSICSTFASLRKLQKQRKRVRETDTVTERKRQSERERELEREKK